MRILYIIHQFYPETSSGTERFLLNLASAVQRDGHHVDVISYSLGLDGRGSKERILVQRYVYGGLPVTAIRHHRIPLNIHMSVDDSDLMPVAAALMESVHPDVIHVAHPMRMGAFVAAAWQCRAPYLMSLTDFWLICPKINLRTSFDTLCTGPDGAKACAEFCPELHSADLQKRLETAKTFLAQAKFVTVPSQFVADVLATEFPEIKVRVIPHGLDLRFFSQVGSLYKKPQKIAFGYCGGLAPNKGVHVLIEAFRSVRGNAELQLHAMFSEKEPYHVFLQQLARGDERIHFCGPYQELQVGEVLCNLDVLVIPSLSYETYGFAMHEAFACKLPVLAADIPTLGDDVRALNAGFTFAPGERNDLRDRLQHIVDEPEVLRSIRDRLEEYVPVLVEEEALLYTTLYYEMMRRG